MNEIKKLSELALYLKQSAETYSQPDYEQLHQELRARYEQQIMEAFMERHPGWSVVEGNAACMMYLSTATGCLQKKQKRMLHSWLLWQVILLRTTTSVTKYF